MRIGIVALFGACLLSACASSNGGPPPGTVASAVGTPFYIAFKIPVCAATVVLGGAAAGAQGLAPTSDNYAAHDIRPAVDQGLRENCGPPYLLTP